MKKITNILLAITLLIGVASCSSEAPFSGEEQKGEGRLLSSALSVELKTDEKLVRATPVPDVNDFIVDFLKADDLSQSVKSFEYGSMPEVVTLPVGDYIVKAYYGGDYGEGKNAAFDKPYYLGQSERFSIEKDKIKDNIGTVECKLSNVKVSIFFDDSLRHALDNKDNATVSVNVGESGALVFKPTTNDSGFFAFDEGSTTLVAVFSGVVDGDSTVETKTYDNVQPGVHYRITFKLHTADPNDPGDINPGDPGNEIKIDAGIQLEDQTGGSGVDVGVGDDDPIYMDDDRYPKEDDPEPGPGPDDPTPDEPGPTVNAESPIDLDKVNEVGASSHVVLNFESVSESGFTTFEVDIISDDLTDDELKGVGLAAHLDLIDPGELLGALQGLGILSESQETVRGEKKVKFDISQFMTPLSLFKGEHHFVIKVADSTGEKIVTLKLKI